jgi:hypothetical protein
MFPNIERAIKNAHLEQEMFEDYYDYLDFEIDYDDDSNLPPNFYVDYSNVNHWTTNER